jgi:signal transduction histidine kinase
MKAPTQVPQAPAWQWPRFVPATALKVLLGHLAVGVTNASWIVVEFRAERVPVPWPRPYFWELTGTFAAFLAFPIVLTAVLNAPRPAGRWGRFLKVHLLAYALYALAIPLLFLGLRTVLHPLLGWGPYEYGPLALKLPMEWIKLLVAYAAIALGVAAWLNFREAQLRARREAELGERLQEARLQVLSAQLDPHFLFNALNTVSSLMYEDLPRTDRLLASLALMLRDGLEAGGPVWPLQRELQYLEAFLAFAEARFGDRLKVRRELQADHGNFQVPRFCLQRLVENALKHNLETPDRVLNLRISVGVEAKWLRLEVADDGGGFTDPDTPLAGAGLGLRNLVDVLGLVYGGEASLVVTHAPGGGARVALQLPLEVAHA